jgi:PKHD-type hydroxylase
MTALTNEWFIFEGALDKKTCNKIKRLAKDNWEDSSVDTSTGVTDEERKTGKKGDYKPDPKTRISDVSWVTDQWVYDTIWPFMEQANKEAGWGYHIKAAESMQITRYRKGGFYNFHQDGRGDHLSTYNNPTNAFMHGHVRKLSMTTLLSDSYEGGEFQFASYGKEECTISTPEFSKVGSIVVFPSSMEHRVAPVTKGIRHSLVTWFVGPPFV